eukprot:4426957-Ditylum_brightwellii.AAC.1
MPAAQFSRLVSTVCTFIISACMFTHWWMTVSLDSNVTAPCTIGGLVGYRLLRKFFVLAMWRWSSKFLFHVKMV